MFHNRSTNNRVNRLHERAFIRNNHNLNFRSRPEPTIPSINNVLTLP